MVISIGIYMGNFIIPTVETIFFRGVGLNHQPDMVFPTGMVKTTLGMGVSVETGFTLVRFPGF